MLDAATFQSTKERRDLYPQELQKQIDDTNDWVYTLLGNGVYKCGFSTTQTAYDEASANVRQGLERCEALLSAQDYLCGSIFTEADLRLLPTALRFDGVYAPLFRASQLRIRDYPALHAWLQRCWAIPGVKSTIDLADANASYYKQLFPLNPGGIVPTPVTAATLGIE
jgi:putative glutathione S-transferase